MTKSSTPIPRFTVYLHPKLEEQFRDLAFFPESELEHLYHDLPRLHPTEPEPRLRKNRLPRRPRVFRGNFYSSNSGFTYLQIGDRLHIVEFWLDSKLIPFKGVPARMDVEIGKPPVKRRARRRS